MKREIVRNEERFAGQSRHGNPGRSGNDRYPNTRDIGLAMLHDCDNAVVRWRLMIAMEPMVQARTRARESGEAQQQHERAGEDRLADRAPGRGDSQAVHVSELKLRTVIAASLFPA